MKFLVNECGIKPEEKLVLGVSGGADSVTLVDLFMRSGITIIIAHYNHSLRLEAESEERFVKNLAQKNNLPFFAGRGDINQLSKIERISIEAAARKYRYQFLGSVASKVKADAIAVAHNANDQVETVLLHFLRGSGLSGLTGMKFRSFTPIIGANIPLVRPLLGFWRSEIEAYCRANGLEYVDDPSNLDERFLRNEIRHSVLPYLEDVSPGFGQRVWQMAEILCEDEKIITENVDSAFHSGKLHLDQDFIQFSKEVFLELNAGLQRRVIRKSLFCLNSEISDLSFAVIDRAVHFILSNSSGTIDLINRYKLEVAGNFFVIFQQEKDWANELFIQLEPGEAYSFDIGETVILKNDKWKLTSRFVTKHELISFETGALETFLGIDDIVSQTLLLRTRRPGDRFQPFGMEKGSMKLSDFFINEKIPKAARDLWPLICSENDDVLWVPGCRMAHKNAVGQDSELVVHLQFKKNQF